MRVSAACSLSGLLTAVLLATAGPSAAQIPPPANLRPAAADPAFEAARRAFEALPGAERTALQEALVWVGDYLGMADGSFGPQTHEAIAAYQRRSRRKPDGVLDAAARAALLAAARQARERVGFDLLEDPRSGVRIGVPLRLLTTRDVNQSGGTRWQSADQKITLDTRSVPPSGGSLQELFDRNVAIRTPGRQVTYKVLRPDFFVIAGETATGKFYTRYGAGDGGLRGFSIGYDKALAQEVDPLVVAIANSFVPFPVAPPVAAASPPPLPAGAAPAAGLLGTGLVVGPHRVVTNVDANDCPNLRAGGFRPRQVHRRDGLTLLEFAETLRPAAFRLASEPDGPDDSRLVLAYSLQGSRLELSVAPATPASDGTISAPLQPGAKGAPVFDRSGALRGLVRSAPDERRLVAGIVPLARYQVESAGLAGLVEGAPPRADAFPHRSAADIASAVRASIMPVTCEP